MAFDEEASSIIYVDEDEDTQQCYAKYPFNNPSKADVVVQTSDNVHFHVYKIILSLISSYFEDLFDSEPKSDSKLWPKVSEDAENAISFRRSLYRVGEDSKVFDAILQWIYPGLAPPTLSKIEDILPVLEAMVKYRMQHTAPFQAATASLLDLAPPKADQPHPIAIRVFAIFQRFRASVPQASLALIKRRCLHIPLEHFTSDPCPELEQISGSALFELVRYHTMCSSAIRTHAPSFNEWHEGCSKLQYKCAAKTGVKRVAMKLDDVKGMYYYLLNHKHERNPFSGIASTIPTATMLEKTLMCATCGHPCRALNKAVARIISEEVLAAVRDVEKVCRVLLSQAGFVYELTWQSNRN
ncbi:hypothetical protein V5O48_015173 [Marasmius crinis-equi]|uniref:BTB domain-containing protein n=1 Tax=Marasmius crinis-equi TaxID=585013 RepID=A0ABR3EVA2_9AGAR